MGGVGGGVGVGVGVVYLSSEGMLPIIMHVFKANSMGRGLFRADKNPRPGFYSRGLLSELGRLRTLRAQIEARDDVSNL